MSRMLSSGLSKNLIYTESEMDSEVIGQRMRWKSKMYPSDIKYDDMPWEKEANRLETKYGNEYLEEIGI